VEYAGNDDAMEAGELESLLTNGVVSLESGKSGPAREKLRSYLEMALLRVQHSAYRKPSSSWSASVLAEYQRKVPSRRTFTRSSFLSFSR
jgi:hypothetical protein